MRDRPHVELREIGKSFYGARALRDINLSLERGGIHALVGENGAGKSTLGKIISGAIRPDTGGYLVDGRLVRYSSPRDALADGIAAIQQEIALVPRLTVLQNVLLGLETNIVGVMQTGSMRRRFDELNGQSGFGLPSDAPVGRLRVADQQKVEILRALARNARLIVMDEPTAALSTEEAAKLLDVVRALRTQGKTIIYVSHYLEEVLRLADTVTVLRNGELIRTASANDETPDTLVSAMLGRPMAMAFPPKSPAPTNTPVVCSVHGLSRRGIFEDVSFNIRQGEILGLAGLVGSGRTEVARVIFGADRRDAGRIELAGEPVVLGSPGDGVKHGLALIPESRKDQGLLMRSTVGYNVTLPHLSTVSRAGVIERRKERHSVGALLNSLGVRPAGTDIRVASLSGGNQQKVLFAKWLFQRPKLLIADEPTRGVDVGAKTAIYELIASLAKEGMAVLLISSEQEEILGLAHRVLVMRRGRIAAEIEGAAITEETIVRSALGSDALSETVREKTS